MSVLGIDCSSKAVDLVVLDDDTNEASWLRLPLDGDPWETCRQLRHDFPRRSWFEEHGVRLVGIEDPFSDRYQAAKALGRVTGAVLALIPAAVTVLPPIPPQTWRRRFLGTAKAAKEAGWERLDEVFPDYQQAWQAELRRHHPRAGLPTDPLEAYAVAWAAREIHDEREAA